MNTTVTKKDEKPILVMNPENGETIDVGPIVRWVYDIMDGPVDGADRIAEMIELLVGNGGPLLEEQEFPNYIYDLGQLRRAVKKMIIHQNTQKS